jgi:hypothetical protein
MKRKITLSIAIALSIALVSLVKSDSTVNAEPPPRVTFDTGVITLGANQILQVTAISGQGSGDPIPTESIVFRQQNYIQTACGGGVCKYAVSSQNTSAPLVLAPNEAATFTCIPGSVTVRAIVLTTNKNTRVNASIIDALTGNIVTSYKLELESTIITS